MNTLIPDTWRDFLSDFLALETYQKLDTFISAEYKKNIVFPPQEDLFNALKYTSPKNVRVVILGQDPYHGLGQAHGLAFSVPQKTTLPPSLKNIYKEIESDTGAVKDFSNGNLQPWAEQGVLLLNAMLSVENAKPGSHTKKGWEEFTDHIIQKISDTENHVVFLLWGNYAKNKGSIIDRSKHLVLESSHPSPLGAYRGFIGCKHFSKANDYLKKNNKKEINW